MSRKERKLDRLKMNPRGASKEALFFPRFFGFWFLVCYVTTQLATPLHQKRIRVVVLFFWLLVDRCFFPLFLVFVFSILTFLWPLGEKCFLGGENLWLLTDGVVIYPPMKSWCFAQVSSMKSTTKLSRFLIDHRRSTVILLRWIGVDRRYQPYSPVGESLSTVDIDRDRSTGSINQWIGIDI